MVLGSALHSCSAHSLHSGGTAVDVLATAGLAAVRPTDLRATR